MIHSIRRICSRSALAVLFLSGFACGAHAYITSAILEYCADDTLAFYLNGSMLLERSEFGPFDYDVLSTADGTLPLELFRENEENLFGVENFDTEAGSMNASFRLTVYHSDGDPVCVWSIPEQSKFLHLAKEEKGPAGWTELNFDDSKWGEAIGVHVTGWADSPKLIDAAFSTLFGPGPVPYLAHRADSKCRGGDHNLFRSKFRFPNNPAKVEVALNPPKAVYGQPVYVRLIPGPDTTELSQFNMMAWLPKNVELGTTAPGAQYDPNLRRISWRTSKREMNLGYLKLHAEKVVSAGGWGAPEKMLGPWKADKPRRKRNIPDAVYLDAAVPNQGATGWFKLKAPDIDFSKGIPKIQGVIFRSQIKMGGRDGSGSRQVDRIMFNYSVDGRPKGALKNDVDIVHTTWEVHWTDGYYHASEDREWTWDDIKNLMVKIEAQQVGQRDRNLIASVVCTVRYYYPNKVAPWFQAKILEKGCADIQFQTGVFRYGSKLISSDPLMVRVNEGLCAPTPVPTSTPLPVRIAQATPIPTSTPIPAGRPIPLAAMGLGCLTVAPDPLDFGGGFISFCMKTGATVTVNIYDAAKGGAGMRRIEAGTFRAGNSQVFFNGLDENGKLLPPGRYICEILAKKEGLLESRNCNFTMVRKRPKR